MSNATVTPEYVRAGEQPSAKKYNQLVEAVRQLRQGPLGGQNIFETGESWRTPRLSVHCATWDNVEFTDDPQAANFDGLTLASLAATEGHALVLVWLQTDATKNGVYQFVNAQPRWRKVFSFDALSLSATEIFVRYGYRFKRRRFAYYSNNRVVPVWDRVVKIHHASKESETPLNLGALLTGYQPTAGDLIFIRGSGLYIARLGAWRQIGALESLASYDSECGLIASQELAILKDDEGAIVCDGNDVIGDFEYHELAVSPSLLNEAP